MLAKYGVYHDGQVEITETVEGLNNDSRVIVLFLDNNTTNEHAESLANLQASTGFAQDVLGNPAEDVWNDL